MSYEEKFHRALKNAGVSNLVYLEFELPHPISPNVYLKVDNLVQINKTLFVFEGKRGGLPEKAISQLRKAYISLKDPLIMGGFLKRKKLSQHNLIRLFYYSFKRGLLIELNSKGLELKQYKFNPTDLNNLSEILRNL